MKYFIFIALVFSLNACKPPQSRNQGVLKGELTWITGNQMPGPEKTADPGERIQRVVLIYPPVQREDCIYGNKGLFVEVPGSPVATVLSSPEGIFTANLDEGMYSVFTREKEGLFAAVSNSEGVMNPVSISRRDTTTIRIDINYTAAY